MKISTCSKLWMAILVTTTFSPVMSQDVVAPRATENEVAWHGAHDIGVEGQGWADVESPFDRLPARAKESVREAVWGLSKHSAGLCVRFVTDATEIRRLGSK
jgi:hypothetical protein